MKQVSTDCSNCNDQSKMERYKYLSQSVTYVHSNRTGLCQSITAALTIINDVVFANLLNDFK